MTPRSAATRKEYQREGIFDKDLPIRCSLQKKAKARQPLSSKKRHWYRIVLLKLSLSPWVSLQRSKVLQSKPLGLKPASHTAVVESGSAVPGPPRMSRLCRKTPPIRRTPLLMTRREMGITVAASLLGDDSKLTPGQPFHPRQLLLPFRGALDSIGSMWYVDKHVNDVLILFSFLDLLLTSTLRIFSGSFRNFMPPLGYKPSFAGIWSWSKWKRLERPPRTVAIESASAEPSFRSTPVRHRTSALAAVRCCPSVGTTTNRTILPLRNTKKDATRRRLEPGRSERSLSASCSSKRGESSPEWRSWTSPSLRTNRYCERIVGIEYCGLKLEFCWRR